MSAMKTRIAELRTAVADYIPGFPKPAPRFVTEDGRRVYGLVAEFDTPVDVYHAAEKVRDAGYRRWDVYSPFPIHGIDDAMGIKKTKLPVFVMGAAFTGVFLGWLMQYWMSAVDYNMVVQGKPYGAWEPFVPIMFEIGVLASAFTAIGSMLALNGLPRWNHPLFSSERFLRISDDRFMICVEADDPAFDPDETRALLERNGGREIALIEDEA